MLLTNFPKNRKLPNMYCQINQKIQKLKKVYDKISKSFKILENVHLNFQKKIENDVSKTPKN